MKFINPEMSFEGKKIYKPSCVRETFIHTQMNILCGKKTRVSSQKCKAYNKRKGGKAFWEKRTKVEDKIIRNWQHLNWKVKIFKTL